MVDDAATNDGAVCPSGSATEPPTVSRLDVAGRGRFLATGGITAEALERVLSTHETLRGSDRCLKWKYGTVITRVSVSGMPGFSRWTASGDVVVKQVPLPWRRRLACCFGARSRFAQDLAISSRLASAGVLTPQVIAHSLSPRGSEEFQLTAFVPGRTLRQALWLGDDVVAGGAERVQLLHQAGRWVAALHRRGIWQRDMKPENVIVRSLESSDQPSSASWEMWLLDITGLRWFPERLDEERCLRNLAQLLDLPEALDPDARPAFLDGYLGTDTEAANRTAWETRVHERVEARRQRRELRNGFRFVDDEHFGTLDRPGHRIQ